VEYLQSWLTDKLEDSGNKQALWRTDPARSGPGGCLGDIGTHAFHLAGFVTGLDATEISANLDTFVPGRRLDDNVRIMMRYPNGAQGMLWASQVTPGHENDLRLRVYGSKGSLSWAQEQPNSLAFARHGEPTRYLTRGGPGLGPAAASATRIPAGHPEGYLEAFAQLYKDAADVIASRAKGRDPAAASQREPAFLPGVIDGAKGVKFIATAVESSRAGGSWIPVSLASDA
jgi:predicted dehydrogenase